MGRRGVALPPDNRFLEKHEERMVEEQRFLRETAEKKYRRTHNYNIIAGTYYDQNKERKFVDAREKLGAMQGRAQQYRLPPSIRYGEGNDYNIINQQVSGSTTPSGFIMNDHATFAREVVLTRNARLSFPRQFSVLCVLEYLHHFPRKRCEGGGRGDAALFAGREGCPRLLYAHAPFD